MPHFQKQSLEIEDMYYSRRPDREKDIICMKIKGLDTIFLLNDTENNRFLMSQFGRTGDGWDAITTEQGRWRKRQYQQQFSNIEDAFFEEFIKEIDPEGNWY